MESGGSTRATRRAECGSPPTVSVVIPAYNRESTIQYCLRSVLAQTSPPLEVLVVDDGSTDTTAVAARGIADDRVRVLVGRHQGAQAARNVGIRAARGEWIAFLDSDDTWVASKLERQLRCLRQFDCHPNIVVHSDLYRYDSRSGSREPWHLRRIEGGGAYHALLRGPAPTFPTMLVSRAALDAIGPLDEDVPAYQEWDTAIRLAMGGAQFVHIREPLVDYHIGHADTISGDGRRGIAGYQYVIDKFRAQIISELGDAAWHDHLGVQLRQSLQDGLWDLAGGYLTQMSDRGNWNWWVLRICASLHVRPAGLRRVRDYVLTLTRRRKTGRTIPGME